MIAKKKRGQEQEQMSTEDYSRDAAKIKEKIIDEYNLNLYGLREASYCSNLELKKSLQKKKMFRQNLHQDYSHIQQEIKCSVW